MYEMVTVMVIGDGVKKSLSAKRALFSELGGWSMSDCSLLTMGSVPFIFMGLCDRENTNLLAAWHGLVEHGLLVRDRHHTLPSGPT